MAEFPDAPSQPPTELQECLRPMLRRVERTIGFAEGAVMSFDPDVLLPNAFAASMAAGMDDALGRAAASSWTTTS